VKLILWLQKGEIIDLHYANKTTKKTERRTAAPLKPGRRMGSIILKQNI